MATFPILELESVVQVGDKTRLDGSKSFISKGENPVTLVRIKPEASGSFITVTGTTSKDWFLDWIYTTDGSKTATIEITTDTTPTSSPVVTTQNFTLSVVTAANDKLFSGDQDLIGYESDILKYVRPGRSSWLDYHRKSQKLIVDWLNEKGYAQIDGTAFTKAAVVDIEEVRQWSACQTLTLIYQNLSNAVGDIFSQKAAHYESMMMDRRARAVVRLDLDGDGTVESGEYVGLTSVRALRR